MKKRYLPVLMAMIVTLIVPYQSVFAINFNNGYLLSDTDLFDYNAMTLAELQSFLDKKNGQLGTYQTLDKNGVMKTAAEIIYQAAQEYKVNPKFLLVMLQKEQSLVDDATPKQSQYDWAAGYGVCDSCDVNSPSLLLFKGFGSQVDRLAGVQRWYEEHANDAWLKQKNQSYIIDGQTVFISNQATANLYNYTPHILGNYNFWKIWNEWFSQKYPDGTLLQAEGEKGVWLVENGLRRPFMSKGALVSRYNINNVVIISKVELEKYLIGNSIKFPNYTLLISPTDNVYMLVDNKLRLFESKQVWQTLGFNPEEFEILDMSDFSTYEFGELITLASSYPAGALLQNKATGGVYFVQDGIKYPIATKDILKINYLKYHLSPVAVTELDKYATGDPIKLRDGELIKSKDAPTVYVISDGKKLPIISGDVFERLGYKWSNIKLVESSSLVNLELGPMIDLDFKK
ncbi:MAG: hypothetical protein AAB766_03545 [Patescibacteria group bacterium]